MGLGTDRLEMYEIAASDAPKWVAAVKEMTQKVEALGPNPVRVRRLVSGPDAFSEFRMEP